MNLPEWKSSAVCPDLYVKEYKEYEKDINLEKLITGKRVAYVGPAPYTGPAGTIISEFIDDFDIVIRAGNLYPIKHDTGFYGRRTDILVHSFNEFEIPEAKRNIDFLKNLKFILCAMVSSDFLEEHEKFFRELKYDVPVQNVNDDFLYKMFREVGTICNVGFSGLLTILKYDIKELYVTGMTFYNMGKYGKVYNEKYYDMVTDGMNVFHKNEEGLISPIHARSDLHDQQSQIQYFKELIKKDDRIHLDEFLTRNFK